MTILLEGMSLIFENRVLNERYPGGDKGFRLTWDNGSFCTDGTISRLSFFESNDGFCTLLSLPSFGLNVSSTVATDEAVFMHGGRPWAPCLWLETSPISDDHMSCWGNPPDKPMAREVEFSMKEVLREEVKIYRQPDHGCIEAC
jgi:hypothetical protein